MTSDAFALHQGTRYQPHSQSLIPSPAVPVTAERCDRRRYAETDRSPRAWGDTESPVTHG
jgi:hypothetical protein